MAVLQVVGALANLITLLILARLLSPVDFGIVAVVSLVTGIIAALGDFGLSQAAIQHPGGTQQVLETASVLRLAIAILLMAVTLVVAPWAALVLGAPDATPAVWVAATLFLVNGLAFAPMTRLTKELQFGTILKAAVASTAASAITSVGMALLGFGYWSVILGSIVAAVVNASALWTLSPWRISPHYDRSLARELIGYGRYLFAMNVFVFLVLNVDNAFVASWLGPAALGYYALAFKWANVPANLLSKVAAQVMMPAYVLLRESNESLKKGYFETLTMVNVVSLPIYAGLFVLADPFVSFALGSRWGPIVPVLQALCLMGILRGLVEPGGYLFMATGRASLMSVTTGLHLVLVVTAVLGGMVALGLTGVAIGVSVAYVGNALLVQHYVKRILGISWWDVASRLRGIAASALAAAVVAGAVVGLFGSGILPSIAAATLGAAAYLATLRKTEGRILARYLTQVLHAHRGA